MTANNTAYAFIVRLKTPRKYKDKDGKEKEFGTYFATAIEPSSLLEAGIAIERVNDKGEVKVSHVLKVDIESIEEVSADDEANKE